MAHDLSRFLDKVEALAKSQGQASKPPVEYDSPSSQQQIVEAIATAIRQNQNSNNYAYITGNTFMSDTIKNISGSTIVTRSNIANSLNTIRTTKTEELAAALSDLSNLIEKTGNPELTELYETFVEEAGKPEPKKSLLRTIWTGIKESLPALAATSTIALSIHKFLS
jgi:hypothetical protein